MELIKKNIHMDRIKCQSAAQVTLEEDINVPDNKPDVGGIILHKAVIQIEEVKPTEDHVSVRGRLLFSVLYQTKDEGQMLVNIDGKIPFEAGKIEQHVELIPGAGSPDIGVDKGTQIRYKQSNAPQQQEKTLFLHAGLFHPSREDGRSGMGRRPRHHVLDSRRSNGAPRRLRLRS